MRKVLSFVVVLALVMSSFSMAFAADTTTAAGLSDIAGNANEDAIQVAYDLSIVTGNPDGTFLPDKTVNRAEFAAMITRALAIPDSALAGYTTTTFKDTDGYGWAIPYLAFCQSKGIMLGDGAGNVMPGRTITVNEAMTMALRAIGYTANSALLVGAWPANYVSIAQNEDLYDDVAKDTTVTKASAAQIIYNLLTVQKVAVNTDGSTDYLWTDKNKDTAANLLNTNLNCTSKENWVLGSDISYEDSIINISDKLGAYGTAYLNDDDELVAFIPDSTALTGKMDGAKFKVGDVKYEFDKNSITTGVAIANGDKIDSGVEIDGAYIRDESGATPTGFAVDNSNNKKTITINADVSGKKIKDIYSVVGWKADYSDLADSDVQEEIADDQSLAGYDFDTDDNDDVLMSSFSLKGVASLDKIAEDNVLYIYFSDDDDVIRKVEVGTETVEGTIEEADFGDSSALDNVTIDGKNYVVSSLATDAVMDLDVDDEGTFYLDADGKIFDFDGTTGKADTYGVVKSTDLNDPALNEDLDTARIKLYLADDSSKTFYLEDKTSKIDWTGTTTDTAVKAGALLGYSLNSDGEIDAIDSSASTGAVTFQSTKVLKFNGTSYSIASDAVVFTYETASFGGDYDTADLKEINTGALTEDAQIILNSDGKVAALLVSDDDVDKDDNSVYGVFNTRTSAKTGDDDIYKFTGFIDGSAFTYKTDDQKNNRSGATGSYNGLIKTFGVYKITLDANDVITKVTELEYCGDKYAAVGGYDDSGMITNGTIMIAKNGLNSSKTVITAYGTDDKYSVADDAVVYKYDKSDKKYTVAKLSSLKAGNTVTLYDTKGDDADGIASVVIFMDTDLPN